MSKACIRGFTLIELFISITILAIIFSLSLSVINSVRESAKRVVCAGKIRQLGMAVLAYTQDNRGLVPNAGRVNGASSGNILDPFSMNYQLLLSYLELDSVNGVAESNWSLIASDAQRSAAWRKKFFRCPANQVYDPTDPNYLRINYNYWPGTALDHPVKLIRLIASAQKSRPDCWGGSSAVPSGQIALFSDSTVVDGSGPTGYFQTQCNHKASRSKLFAWSDDRSGRPAGGNICSSDGSVSWAEFLPPSSGSPPYDKSTILDGKLRMVINGGSIGTARAVPSNMLWIRTSIDGNPSRFGVNDSLRTYDDNLIIGLNNYTYWDPVNGL